MANLIKFKTPKKIEKELALVEKGDYRSWGNLFLLIDSIEQTNYWIRYEDSFSKWIDNNASRLQTKPSMVWRILSAGRFVRMVAERYKEEVAVPSLEMMPDAISPENIEILSKLDRVMPSDKFTYFACRVFEGKANRSSLRRVWEIYRPALAGKTARGRGVAAPRIDQQDPKQYRSFLEATALDALNSAGSAWTGNSTPSIYKVILHVNPEGYFSAPGLYLFSAVAVVKPQNSPMEYHGICFGTLPPPVESYEIIRAYCDHFWVLIHSDIPAESRQILLETDGIGILEFLDGTVSAIKPALATNGSGNRRLDLASALLIRSLGEK